MPSNWLYIDTNFPTFTGEEETEEKVSAIQNYLFMLVEQLRYSLRNLDARNMNQTALKEFTRELTEPIYGRIEDTDGNLAELAVTARGIAARVSDAEGNISSLQMTATSLSSQIQNANGDISALQQTAAAIQSTVSNQAGQISAINQKADSISATVANQAGQISSVTQTVDGLTISVANPYGGSTTMINGGSVYTENLYLDSLYGNSIYLKDSEGRIATEFRVTGAASATNALDVWARGIRLNSYPGDVYLHALQGYVTLAGDTGVTCANDFYPNRANAYNCGTYGFPWRDVYTQDGTVMSSDARGKKDIDYNMGRYSGLFDRLRPCSFLRTNGTSGRRHHGFIAQDVRAALETEGMTGKDFAGYVDWEDGEEYGFGLRYEEMFAMVVHEVQEAKKRIAQICKRLEI